MSGERSAVAGFDRDELVQANDLVVRDAGDRLAGELEVDVRQEVSQLIRCAVPRQDLEDEARERCLRTELVHHYEHLTFDRRPNFGGGTLTKVAMRPANRWLSILFFIVI